MCCTNQEVRSITYAISLPSWKASAACMPPHRVLPASSSLPNPLRPFLRAYERLGSGSQIGARRACEGGEVWVRELASVVLRCISVINHQRRPQVGANEGGEITTPLPPPGPERTQLLSSPTQN
ncbi:hypothetical protein BS78_05G149400 [Paspalum vaginatum]|nr:hypothetical protein BS78_05G149400 [Paspalum vaginatum]